MDSAVISIENVTKVYPNGVVANRDVSLEVNSGEIVCLVGPNGAGKTTLVRQIMGLVKPTRGKILVLGVDPFDKQRVVRENIGYVPQAPLVFPAHRVDEVLEYMVSLAGGSLSLVDELLELLGLRNVKNILGYQLSLGQRKLLLIAMALAKNPRILVMDEPTSFIDIVRKRLVWKAILNAKKEGKTVLLVSHDIEEITRLCDRVYIMVKGRIVYHGDTKYVREFSGVELRIYTNNPCRIAEKIKHGVLKVEDNVLTVSYSAFNNALKDLEKLVNSKHNSLKYRLNLEYPSITSVISSFLSDKKK